MRITNSRENMEKANSIIGRWVAGNEISSSDWEFLGHYVMMLSTWCIRRWYPNKSYDDRADALAAAYVYIFDKKIFAKTIKTECWNANATASLICWIAGRAASNFFHHKDLVINETDFGKISADAMAGAKYAVPVEN